MQADFVVQMEGYLVKRGSGYKKNLALTKTEGKPAGGKVLSLLPPAATTLRNMMASGEKKRYFILATCAADGMSKAKAEIRYFEKQRALDYPTKGLIELHENMRVELSNHSSICLVTPGRTYYLRPDENNRHSATARLEAGKWIYCINFAIEGLRAFSLMGTTDISGLHPVTRLSTKMSLKDIQNLQEKVKLALGNGGEGSSATKTIRDVTQAYESLWDNYGLTAYNALVAHFGPVLIDLERLEYHIEVRCKIIDRVIRGYQNQAHKSFDVELSDQKTLATALRAIYKTTGNSAVWIVQKVFNDLQDVSVLPIKNILRKVRTELESIIKFHGTTTSNIERLYKGVSEMNRDISDLEVALHACMEGRMAAKRGSAKHSTKSLMRSGRKSSFAVHMADPVQIAAQIEQQKQMIAECNAALRVEEAKHGVRMKMALRSLQALEIERLGAEKELLAQTLQVELAAFRLTLDFYDHKSSCSAKINAIDASADVEGTSDMILKELSQTSR